MARRVTHNQQLLLHTLSEHRKLGGEAIAIRELGVELNRRHNRTMGYDALHSVLKGLHGRGLVGRDHHRPTRWAITEAGETALAESPPA